MIQWYRALKASSGIVQGGNPPQPTSGDFLVAELGQSNMEGRDGDTGNPSYPFTSTNGYEYTGSQTEAPITTLRGGAVGGSHANYFCEKFFALTGKKARMVELSSGGAGLTETSKPGNNWSSSDSLRSGAVAQINSALTFYGDIPLCALWCQGERDAQEMDSNAAYTREIVKVAMQDVIDWWFGTYPNAPFIISESGDKSPYANTQGWKDMRAIQNEIAAENPLVFIGFNRAKYFGGEGKMIADGLHYNYLGYTEMGEALATMLANYATEGTAVVSTLISSINLLSPTVSASSSVNTSTVQTTQDFTLQLIAPSVSAIQNVTTPQTAESFSISLISPSVTAIDSGALTAPANLTMVANTSTSIQVSWDAVAGAEEYYVGFQRVADGTTYWDWITGTSHTKALPSASKWNVEVYAAKNSRADVSPTSTIIAHTYGNMDAKPSAVTLNSGATLSGTATAPDALGDLDNTTYIELASGGGSFNATMDKNRYSDSIPSNLAVSYTFQLVSGDTGTLNIDVLVNGVSAGILSWDASTVTAGNWVTGTLSLTGQVLLSDTLVFAVSKAGGGSPAQRASFRVSKLGFTSPSVA